QHREGNARYREVLATNAAAVHRNAAGTDDGDVVAPKLYAKSFRGEHVPDIYVQRWLGGTPELTNKFGLVVFWAPDSDACKEAFPHLNELHEKFNETVVFFGLTDKPAEELKKMPSAPFDFPTAVDTEQRTMKIIELQAVPHVILADKQGIVRFEGPPAYLTQKAMQQLLDKYAE